AIVARYVSLVPFVSDASAFPGLVDIWNTCEEFLDYQAGDEEEHAVLLANYLTHLTSGGADTQIYLALGNAVPEGATAYVIEMTGNEKFVWNASTGFRYKAQSDRSTLVSIDCLINSDGVYINRKPYEEARALNNPLDGKTHWLHIPKPESATFDCIQQPIDYGTDAVLASEIGNIEYDIELAVRKEIESLRARVPTLWYNGGAKDVRELLKALETYHYDPNNQAIATAKEAHNRMFGSKVIVGYPLQMSYKSTKEILNDVRNTKLHEIGMYVDSKNTVPKVQFSCVVYVHHQSEASKHPPEAVEEAMLQEFEHVPDLLLKTLAGSTDELRNLLVDCNAEDVNAQDPGHRTALHAAAHVDQPDIARLLLQSGANVECKDAGWQTPLHRACASKSAGCAQVLLEYQPLLSNSYPLDPTDQSDSARQPPLSNSYPLDPTVQSDSARQPLLSNSYPLDPTDQSDSARQPLLSNSYPLDPTDQSDSARQPLLRDRGWQTPLHAAAAHGSVDCAWLLLPHLPAGALTCVDRDGHTALHHAALNGQTEVAQLLLTKAPELVNIEDRQECRPLHWAACHGSEAMLELLVRHGAELNAPDELGFTALHAAAACGHVLAVRRLVSLGADCELTTRAGNTPLHLACLNGFDQVCGCGSGSHQSFWPDCDARSHSALCLDWLIDEFANVHVRCRAGRTPLHMAALHGRASRAQTLLADRASVDAVDSAGYSPLGFGALGDHQLLLEALIRAGASVGAPARPDGLTALHLASLTGFLGCVQRLRLADVEGGLDRADRHGRTCLHAAASAGRADVVQHLLDRGADAGAVDCAGRTPLHLAAARGHEAAALALLSHDARLADAPDAEGRTPLHLAAASADLRLIRRLIACDGSGAGRFDHRGRLPLHFALASLAAAADAAEAAAVLAEATPMTALVAAASTSTATETANPQHLAAYHGREKALAVLARRLPMALDGSGDAEGRTPLHLASARGCLSAVRVLLADDFAVGDVRDRSRQWSAVHYAAAGGHAVVLRALLTAAAGRSAALTSLSVSAAVEAADSTGRRPLMLAAQNGHEEAVKVLLEAGAQPDATDFNGLTSLHRAAACGHVACVGQLLSAGARPDIVEPRLRRQPLHLAAAGGHVDAIARLLDAADIVKVSNCFADSVDACGFAPLHWAAAGGHVTSLNLLLSRGCRAGRHRLNWSRFSLLHCAAAAGREACVQILLQHRAEQHHQVPTRYEYFPSTSGIVEVELRCTWPPREGHPRVAELLLRHGATVDAVDCRGRTPLMTATAAAASARAGWGRDNQGRTPLHLACAGALPDVAVALIQRGAPLFAVDAAGQVPALACTASRPAAECLQAVLDAMLSAAAACGGTPTKRRSLLKFALKTIRRMSIYGL
uniref:ANK_REP_REGION domain-containing protein n=1 Tax=Macrostomum lignano TaxID=282301 RepID=A0A1I8HX91_9PLAT